MSAYQSEGGTSSDEPSLPSSPSSVEYPVEQEAMWSDSSMDDLPAVEAMFAQKQPTKPELSRALSTTVVIGKRMSKKNLFIHQSTPNLDVLKRQTPLTKRSRWKRYFMLLLAGLVSLIVIYILISML
jgi:hypothetical protein